jgi:hypothetical protein
MPFDVNEENIQLRVWVVERGDNSTSTSSQKEIVDILKRNESKEATCVAAVYYRVTRPDW